MKTNHLKAFIRYSNNKVVAGSLILATTMPKTGVWKEVDVDLCCPSDPCAPGHPGELLGEIPSYPFTFTGFNLGCALNGMFFGAENSTIVNSTEELLTLLNTYYSSIGTYSLDNLGNIVLTMPAVLVTALNCVDTMMFVLFQI